MPNGGTLSEKRHADVMGDIRNMLHDLNTTERSFASSYQDSTGRTPPCLNLLEDHPLTLVSGYSVVLRKRIIDRWLELEAAKAPTPAIPTNFAGALRPAAAKVERREEVDKAERWEIAEDELIDRARKCLEARIVRNRQAAARRSPPF